MNSLLRNTLLGLGLALTPAAARAQFSIDWHVVDGGGGVTSNPTFSITGAIAQPDASAPEQGGVFTVTGGFIVGTNTCYPNCDGSTTPPILNANDFQCFLGKFAIGDPYANCDGSTVPPTLNANDFACFLNKYVAGCP